MSAIMPTTPEANFDETWAANPLTHLVRHLVRFTKGLFAQCPAGSYRWCPETERSPDQKGSEIFITSETPLKMNEYVGKRPAIAILRGPAAFQGIGIGDRAFTDMSNGAQSKMDIIPTTLTFNVLSRVALEAENLAWFVGSHVWMLREFIAKGQRGLLYMGNRPSFSPVSPAGSLVSPDTEHNWVVCTISFPVFLQHAMHSMPLHCGPGTGVVQEIELTMKALGDAALALEFGAEEPGSPKPVIPLQGTAVMQPKIDPGRVGEDGQTLPQTGESEAQSMEPLSTVVKIIGDS